MLSVVSTKVRALVLIVAVSTIAVGCGSKTASPPTLTTSPDLSSCLAVPAATVTRLEAGLRTDQGRVSLVDSRAVKVAADVYYVSALLHGPGLSGADVATWSVNSLVHPAAVRPVDTVTKEFSNGKAPAPGVSDAQAAQAARNCVGQAQDGGIFH